jgi:hypothetical protein
MTSRLPAPDALDESRDAVNRVAVVRHDAAHAPLHMHQPPVAAREQQMPALARAVVGERDLAGVKIVTFDAPFTGQRGRGTSIPPAQCCSVGVERDPAAAGGSAAQCNRIGRVRFKSGQDVVARVVAYNGTQLLQREKRPEVVGDAVRNNAVSHGVVLRKSTGFQFAGSHGVVHEARVSRMRCFGGSEGEVCAVDTRS